MTTEKSADRVAKIAAILSEAYPEMTVERAATEVLTDLRHICDYSDLAFAIIDRRAHNQYTDEIVEARRAAQVMA